MDMKKAINLLIKHAPFHTPKSDLAIAQETIVKFIRDHENCNGKCLCKVTDIDEEKVGTIEINSQCPFHG